jgi:hypothetical protein
MKRFASTAILPLLALAACVDDEGPLERLGEEIDEAAEDIQVQGETPANELDDAVDELRQAAEDAADEAEDAL